jgi:hypothetical protein
VPPRIRSCPPRARTPALRRTLLLTPYAREGSIGQEPLDALRRAIAGVGQAIIATALALGFLSMLALVREHQQPRPPHGHRDRGCHARRPSHASGAHRHRGRATAPWLSAPSRSCPAELDMTLDRICTTPTDRNRPRLLLGACGRPTSAAAPDRSSITTARLV